MHKAPPLAISADVKEKDLSGYKAQFLVLDCLHVYLARYFIMRLLLSRAVGLCAGALGCRDLHDFDQSERPL